MPAPAINVNHLSKHYKFPVRGGGLKAATKSLFKRTYYIVKAMDGISVTTEPGEIVGFFVPVAFAVPLPAEALTTSLTPLTLLGILGVAVLLIVLARFIWRLGVRSYSGASA